MTAIPYTISRDALTLFIDGVPYTANKDHPRYQEITELLLSRNDFTSEQMLELVSIKKQIEQVLVRFQVDDVTVGQDAVYYKGSPQPPRQSDAGNPEFGARHHAVGPFHE